ncbi:unnamed protein product, partial [Ectocarpus fasciculatus]
PTFHLPSHRPRLTIHTHRVQEPGFVFSEVPNPSRQQTTKRQEPGCVFFGIPNPSRQQTTKRSICREHGWRRYRKPGFDPRITPWSTTPTPLRRKRKRRRT